MIAIAQAAELVPPPSGGFDGRWLLVAVALALIAIAAPFAYHWWKARQAKPPAPAPAPAPAPIDPIYHAPPVAMVDSYPHLEQFLAAIKASNTAQSINLDGVNIHAGFGPALAYYTLADGSISTTRQP